ncbi:MAG: hypothetical protein OXH57_10810, partial [Ekhidna sp.]|nr:hypothetical protein [Ekhidna sp.]
VVTGSNSFVTLVQRDTSVYDDAEEFIAFEDEIVNEESWPPFSSDIPAKSSADTMTLATREFEFKFNPEDGEEIDSAFFKGGTLNYTLTSPFASQIAYTLTVTDVQDVSTGNTLVLTGTLVGGETSISDSTPLEGKKNVARREGSSNIFNVELDLIFIIPPDMAIDASEEITLEVVFEDAEFSAIFGSFDADPVEVQQKVIRISVFDDFSDDGLFLTEPTATLEFINTFGIEFGVSLANVKSVNSGVSEILLTGAVTADLQFVDAPNSSQLGESDITSIEMNVSNSNIDDLLSSTPDSLTFTVDATPNPPGSDNANNYLLDSSYLEIRTIVEVPLDLRMDGFSRDFTSSIDGTELSDADSITINLRTINEIPFDGTLDFSFQNDAGEVLYTLLGVESIESAEVGDDERTLRPVEKASVVRLNGEGIDAFLKTKKIIMTLNMSTFDTESGKSVRIYSDYRIDIFLTAQGKVAIDL